MLVKQHPRAVQVAIANSLRARTGINARYNAKRTLKKKKSSPKLEIKFRFFTELSEETGTSEVKYLKNDAFASETLLNESVVDLPN